MAFITFLRSRHFSGAYLSAVWVIFTILGLTVLMIGTDSELYAQTESNDLSPQAIRDALTGGVEYLREKQLKNGSWDEYPGYNPGTTALCALALLSAGLDKNDPMMTRALEYLRKPLIDSEYQTYPVALQTMVFCLADPERDRERIQKNIDWIIAGQFHTQNVFNGGWSYVGSHQQYNQVDNSNSQFAVLALFEAERIGIKIPEEVWKDTEQYWLRMQNEDGSWGYRASLRNLQQGKSGVGTGSMTCAGIAALVICNGVRATRGASAQGEEIRCCQELDDEISKRIELGLNWMAKHFSVQTNPGTVEDVDSWVFYYLYGLERVGRLTANRFIGRNDWYREGADFLLKRKGLFAKFWKAQIDLKGNHAVSTSFALLFLSKGRRPVLISKYKFGTDMDWNLHPNDLLHLTQYTETQWHRDLIWQIVDSEKATVDDLLQTPVLYFSGTRSPIPTDPALKRKMVNALRGYLEQGGFLWAEALDGDTSFETGFRQLLKEVLPEEGMEPQLVPEDHPLWNAEKTIPVDQLRPIYGVDFGCRTSVVLIPSVMPGAADGSAAPSVHDVRPSLSCLWELSPGQRKTETLAPGVARQVSSALDIGINILAYATNREMKYKEEMPAALPDESGNVREYQENVYIGLLDHAGSSGCAPRAIPNLMKTLRKELGIPVETTVRRFPATSKELFECPIVFMHGRNTFHFSDADRKNMRLFFDRGGFLFANAICGSETFSKSFMDELKKIYPEDSFVDIPSDDPLYTNRYGGYNLAKVEIRKPGRVEGRKIQAVQTEEPPRLRGIKKDGRWIVVFSPYDVSCALEQAAAVSCSGYSPKSAFQLAVNILLYGIECL